MIPILAAGATGLSDILTDITSVLTTAISWVGSVLTEVTGNGALFLFVIGFGAVGYAVHMTRLLFRAN